MATNIKATDSTSMEIKENQSIVVEDGMATTRLVTCKDGTKEPYSETNLRASLDRQLEGLNKDYLNLDIIMTKVSSGLYNGVTTKEITNLAAETCAYMAIVHPDYTKLANKVTVQALHNSTHTCILDVANQLFNYKDK